MRRRGISTLTVLRAAAALLALTLGAQAFAQGLFDDNEARRRVDALRQQLDTSQRSIDERMTKLESAAADRGGILELSNQINALRDEIARMRGQMELLSNQADNADKRQKDLYLDIDTRLRKLEQAGEKSAAEKPAAATEAEASPAENKAYQAALEQFKLGNYPLAVSAMQGFLVTYPLSPLASNAQYWVGMAYSGQRDYKNAIVAQRKLLSTWPDSAKAPDALLSIASSQETMGDRRGAQKTLEELVARYPTSSSAASAKQRLAAFSKR
jgi:tol-pal system protein YbgF